MQSAKIVVGFLCVFVIQVSKVTDTIAQVGLLTNRRSYMYTNEDISNRYEHHSAVVNFSGFIFTSTQVIVMRGSLVSSFVNHSSNL